MNCRRLASYWEQLLHVLAGLLGVVVKPPIVAPPFMSMTLAICDPSGFRPVRFTFTSLLLDGDSIISELLVLVSAMALMLYVFVIVGSLDAVNTSVAFPMLIDGRLKGVAFVFISVTVLPLTTHCEAFKPRFAHVDAPPMDTGPAIGEGDGIGGVGSCMVCGSCNGAPPATVAAPVSVNAVLATPPLFVQLPTPVIGEDRLPLTSTCPWMVRFPFVPTSPPVLNSVGAAFPVIPDES